MHSNVVRGFVLTLILPLFMACIMDFSFFAAAIMEYVFPNCHARWASDVPTIGMVFSFARCMERRLGLKYLV